MAESPVISEATSAAVHELAHPEVNISSSAHVVGWPVHVETHAIGAPPPAGELSLVGSVPGAGPPDAGPGADP